MTDLFPGTPLATSSSISTDNFPGTPYKPEVKGEFVGGPEVAQHAIDSMDDSPMKVLAQKAYDQQYAKPKSIIGDWIAPAFMENLKRSTPTKTTELPLGLPKAKGVLGDIQDVMYGVPEALGTLVSGGASFVLGTTKGAPRILEGLPGTGEGGSLSRGLGEAGREAEKFIEEGTYQPKTATGKMLMRPIELLFGTAMDSIERGVRQTAGSSIPKEEVDNRVKGAQYLFNIGLLGLPAIAKKVGRGERLSKDEVRKVKDEISKKSSKQEGDVFDEALKVLEKEGRPPVAPAGEAIFKGNQDIVDALNNEIGNKEGYSKRAYTLALEKALKNPEEITSENLILFGKDPKKGTRRFVADIIAKRESIPEIGELKVTFKDNKLVEGKVESNEVGVLSEVEGGEGLFEGTPLNTAEIVKQQLTNVFPEGLETPPIDLEAIKRGNELMDKVMESPTQVPLTEMSSEEILNLLKGEKKVEVVERPESEFMEIVPTPEPTSKVEVKIPEFSTLDELQSKYDVGVEIPKEQAILEVEAPESAEFGVGKVGDKYYRTVTKVEMPRRQAPTEVKEKFEIEEDYEPSESELKGEELGIRQLIENERDTPTVEPKELSPALSAGLDRWKKGRVRKIATLIKSTQQIKPADLAPLDLDFSVFKSEKDALDYAEVKGISVDRVKHDGLTDQWIIEPEFKDLDDFGWETSLKDVEEVRTLDRAYDGAEEGYASSDTGLRDVWEITNSQSGMVRGIGPIGLVGTIGVEASKIFYSKAMEVLDTYMSDKAISAEEILKTLRNSGIGKHEEQASNLGKFFEDNAGKRIRPSKVKEFIEENLFEVKEVDLEVRDIKYKEYAEESDGLPNTYKETFLTVEFPPMSADWHRGTEWMDGHPLYEDISNPIVRVIHDEVKGKDGSPVFRVLELQTPILETQYKFEGIQKKFNSIDEAKKWVDNYNSKDTLDLYISSDLIGKTLSEDFNVWDNSPEAFKKTEEYILNNKQWALETYNTMQAQLGTRNRFLNTTAVESFVRTARPSVITELAQGMGFKNYRLTLPKGTKITPEIYKDKFSSTARPMVLDVKVRIFRDTTLDIKDITKIPFGPFRFAPEYIQKNAYNMGVKWIIAKAKEQGINKIQLTTGERIVEKYARKQDPKGIVRLYNEDLVSKFTRQLGKDAIVDKGKKFVTFDIGEGVPSIFSILGDQRGSIDITPLRLSIEKRKEILRLMKELGKSADELLSGMGMSPESVEVFKAALTRLPQDQEQLKKIDPIIENIINPDPSTIIHQRVTKLKNGKTRTHVPVTDEYYDGVFGARKLDWDISKRLGRFMEGTETRIHGFERYGSKVKELFWDKWVEKLSDSEKERKVKVKEIRELKKSLTSKEREGLAIAWAADQKGGVEALRADGITNIPLMNVKQLEVRREMNDKFGELLDRINYVRTKIGLAPIPRLENYFPFIREQNALRNAGILDSLIVTSISKITANSSKFKGTFFPFEKPRSKSQIPIELDVFNAYEQYLSYALKEIHVAPIAALAKELAGERILQRGLKSRRSAKKLIDVNPGLAKLLTHWSDEILGVDTVTRVMSQKHPFITKTFSDANRNLVAAMIFGNVGTVLKQPTALKGTYSMTSMPDLMYGISRLMIEKPFKWVETEAMAKSNVLDIRRAELILSEFEDSIRLGTVRGGRKLAGQITAAPMNIVDALTAEVSWNAGYRHAKKTLKLKEREAIQWADDLVAKTQGMGIKGAVSPIQSTYALKWLTMLQTYAIADFNFVARDLLGIKNPDISKSTQVKRVVRYLVGASLINQVFQMMGMDAPNPAPIQAYNETEERYRDKKVALLMASKEFLEMIPLLGGSAKFGSSLFGPLGELASDLPKGLTEATKLLDWENMTDKQKFNTSLFIGELLGMYYGVPMTRQLKKSIRTASQGGTPYEIILGTYIEENRKKGGPSGMGSISSSPPGMD